MMNFYGISNIVAFLKSWYKKIALLICIGFFSWLGLTNPLQRQIAYYLRPIVVFNTSFFRQVIVPVNNLRRSFHAARRVQSLEYQLAHAQAQLSQLEQLKKENQDLRKMIENKDRDLTKSWVSSPVLSLAQPAVVLPEEKDLSLPIAVLVQQTLVGVSTRKHEQIAYVSLLWQQNAAPVLAQTESGVEGLISGDGKRVLLTEIPMEEEIVVGERVVTTGQEGIASGLHVGQVQSIESGPSSAVKQAVVEQYVSFYESTIVELR